MLAGTATRWSVFLAVVVAAWFAGTPDRAAGQADRIRLGWQTGDLNFVTVVAKERGFFEQAGLDAQLVPFSSGATMISAFAAKEIDLGWIFAFPPTTMYAGGLEVEIILFDHVPKSHERLVARPELKSLKDLKGRPIGVTVGSSGNYWLLQALGKAGLTAADVRIVNLPPAGMAPAYVAGQIDAAQTWEPAAGTLNKQGAVNLATLESLGGFSPGLWVARSEYVRNNPRAIQKFLKAWDMALTAFKANKRDAFGREAKRLNISVDEVEWMYNNMNTSHPSFAEQLSLTYLGRPGQQNQLLLVTAVQNYAKFLKDIGRIKDLPGDWTRFVNPEPLNTYMKSAK